MRPIPSGSTPVTRAIAIRPLPVFCGIARRTAKAARGHVQRFEVYERGPLRRDTSRVEVLAEVDVFERRRHRLRQRSCARETMDVICDLWRESTVE